ncbi:MAG: hypothetical protein WC876_06750, partial [Candidatus Thermoplasmatota archaeon]
TLPRASTSMKTTRMAFHPAPLPARFRLGQRDGFVIGIDPQGLGEGSEYGPTAFVAEQIGG